MHRIGFIDEEPAQRNQFYQTFKEDFEVYLVDLNPDATEEELIQEALNNQVNALVVDYQMDDFFKFNGDKVTKKLDEINPYFPTVLLTSHESDALDFVDNANIVNSKDIWSGDSPQDLEIFKKKLTRLIINYNDKINNHLEKLKMLEDKRRVKGLEPNEEQEYAEVNNFLEKVFGRGSYISAAFYSEETNKRLDSLIEKTEQLLSKLSKK